MWPLIHFLFQETFKSPSTLHPILGTRNTNVKPSLYLQAAHSVDEGKKKTLTFYVLQVPFSTSFDQSHLQSAGVGGEEKRRKKTLLY